LLDSAPAIMGTRSQDVTVSDLVDGEGEDARVSVRVSQQGSNHGVFAMQQPFSFVSVGPTNLEQLVLRKGDVLSERFVVDVADGPLSAA
jgi:hypothetical protein